MSPQLFFRESLNNTDNKFLPKIKIFEKLIFINLLENDQNYLINDKN